MRPPRRPHSGSTPLRIAHVAPVATSVPPVRSGSVETMTSLLTEGLVRRGHDVTLFATGDSTTRARLHANYAHGYCHDELMWPWELHELFNIVSAVERAADFDLIHYEAEYYPMSLAFTRLSKTPIVQTLHYSPAPSEVSLWSRYPEAPFVAISNEQARLLEGLTVVGTVLHAVDTESLVFNDRPDNHLLFVGRGECGMRRALSSPCCSARAIWSLQTTPQPCRGACVACFREAVNQSRFD